MFHHTHPYEPFLFPEATKLIVGTLPPPRFTTREFKEGDVDFCYGSRDGQLWPILDRLFNLNLLYETSERAIQQRKDFLVNRKIGICDIVASARRKKVDATDLGMDQVQLRDLIGILKEYPKVQTLLFTGGNSKNGPEYFFRRLLKDHGIKYNLVSGDVPRRHSFVLKNDDALQGLRKITTVSLTAPSGSANRAVGSMKEYQEIKSRQPDFNTLDFRVNQYQPYF